MSRHTIEQVARALLALEQATSPTRAREADALALQLLRALEAARRTGVPLPQRYRLLAYQTVAAYEAIHGVSCVASHPGFADCLT